MTADEWQLVQAHEHHYKTEPLAGGCPLCDAIALIESIG